jgi:hypothetical protein
MCSFWPEKGGKSLDQKNEYIFVIWALKGMSPVNLNNKFEKNVDCFYGLMSTPSIFRVPLHITLPSHPASIFNNNPCRQNIGVEKILAPTEIIGVN